MRVGVAGLQGRMGREIVLAAEDRAHVEIIGGLVRSLEGHENSREGLLQTEELHDLLPSIDLLVDFSVPRRSAEIAEACRTAYKPLVSGVTGLTEKQEAAVRAAGTDIPVFRATNLSVGVAVMLEATRLVASLLPNADVEIVERHHRHKVDAPSGTALSLLGAFDDGLQRVAPPRRGGSARTAGSIGVHALRGGGNPGQHEVVFMADGEEFSLAHRALSRRTFADGALDVATWLIHRPPGNYGMTDFLRSRQA